MRNLPPLLPYAFMVWYLIKLWAWLQNPLQIGCCISLCLVWCAGTLPHTFGVELSLTTTQILYSGSISFSSNSHDNIKLRWNTWSHVLFVDSFYYMTYLTLGDQTLGHQLKCQLYFLIGCVFLVEHRHWNYYHANTQRPDKLGHSPVLFRDPHMVS